MEMSGWWHVYCCHDCNLIFAIQADTDSTERASCPKCRERLPVTSEGSKYFKR